MSSGSRSDGRSIGTSVGDGENLPEMSVAVFPVDVLAAEAMVDQHVVLSARAAPVREARGLDAAEDRVEVGVADAEAEVVALELLAVGEVEGQRLVDVDWRDLAPCLFPADTQEVGQELRRGDAMVRGHDDVVELDGHDPTSDGVGTLQLLQAHIFPGRCEIELRAQADARLLDPRADPVQRGRLEDSAEHDAVVHQALDLMQERLALLAVALLRLLSEQIVDVRMSAGRVRRGTDDEVLDARG